MKLVTLPSIVFSKHTAAFINDTDRKAFNDKLITLYSTKNRISEFKDGTPTK
jgi:hypothetical protein